MARRLCQYCEEPLGRFAKLLYTWTCKNCAYRMSMGTSPSRPRREQATAEHDCYSGFSNLLTHLGENLEAHADRDGLQGARRAVFLARGGHAPGIVCPSEPPREPEHYVTCEWPDDECTCPPGLPA